MAMTDIGINSSGKVDARRLTEAINSGRFSYYKLKEIKTVMDSYVDGANYAGIAVAFGIYTRDVNGDFTTTYDLAKAADLWYLVGNAITAIEAATTYMQLLSEVNPQF